MLSRAVEAVLAATGRVIVVASTGTGEAAADAVGGSAGDVRVVEDAAPFEGPLAGLAAGLAAAPAPLAVVAPGDAPWIVPAVLTLLASVLEGADPGVAAAFLLREGRPERFPFAVRTEAARAAADDLVARGERRLAALTDRLGSVAIPEGRWRALDPEGLSLRDVDRPEDLPGL